MNNSPAFPIMPPVDGSGGSAAGYPFPDAGLTKLEWVATHIYVAVAGNISAAAAVEKAVALLAACKEAQS